MIREVADQLPNVLIVAPNASSRFGGESLIPLQYFRLLRARGYPVKLVTHARNRNDLELAVAPYLADVSFVEDTVMHRLLWRLGSAFPIVIREVVFGSIMAGLDAALQSRIIRKLLEAGDLDLIHQPTPVSPLAPSGLHRFRIPLVIGPMNGGMNYPPGYDDLEGPRARQFVAWSRRLAWLLNRLVPGKRKAALLLVANARTSLSLPFPDHPDVRILVENGVDLTTWSFEAESERDREPGTIRLVFMGRLVPWKMVDITLVAVRRSLDRGGRVTLDLLGDGSERQRLETLAMELGIADAIRFHGFLPQADCAAVLARADVLILNSVRECGGAVVLEAMAMGLPVIASDWGGPADYLDASCGILVSPVPRASYADRLAEAILRLATDPALCRRLGIAGARKVMDHFDWQKKIDVIVGLYSEVTRAESRQSPNNKFRGTREI